MAQLCRDRSAGALRPSAPQPPCTTWANPHTSPVQILPRAESQTCSECRKMSYQCLWATSFADLPPLKHNPLPPNPSEINQVVSLLMTEEQPLLLLLNSLSLLTVDSYSSLHGVLNSTWNLKLGHLSASDQSSFSSLLCRCDL